MKIQNIENVIMKLNDEYSELSDEKYNLYRLGCKGGGIWFITFLGNHVWANGDSRLLGIHQDEEKALEIYLRSEAKGHIPKLFKIVNGESE